MKFTWIALPGVLLFERLFIVATQRPPAAAYWDA